MSEKKFVLSHVIENDSAMTEQFTSKEEHFNVPWKVGIERSNDKIGCYLYCNKPKTDGDWSISTNFNIKIVSINGKTISKSLEYTFGTTSKYIAYGNSLFTTWEKFKEDYLVGDKIIIEAHVTIIEMKGVEIPKKLRSFESADELSNAVLKVGDEKFHVSKQLLAIHSSYFKSLFFGKFDESKQVEVTLKDVNPEYFQIFLEMLYHQFSLTDSNIEGVFKLVDMYNFENGFRLCEHFLIFDSKHSLRTKIRLAACYKLEKLKKQCFEKIKSAAEVRSVLGPDLAELDPLVSNELAEKALSFCV